MVESKWDVEGKEDKKGMTDGRKVKDQGIGRFQQGWRHGIMRVKRVLRAKRIRKKLWSQSNILEFKIPEDVSF